jgi:hypothetical protein
MPLAKIIAFETSVIGCELLAGGAQGESEPTLKINPPHVVDSQSQIQLPFSNRMLREEL